MEPMNQQNENTITDLKLTVDSMNWWKVINLIPKVKQITFLDVSPVYIMVVLSNNTRYKLRFESRELRRSFFADLSEKLLRNNNACSWDS